MDELLVKFERWAKEAGLDLRRHNDMPACPYISTATSWAWVGYNNGWQDAKLTHSAFEQRSTTEEMK